MSLRARWILVWFFACLPLLGWWLTGLFDLDEGFYAAVTSEMNRRGEWITPYYNGQPWFEKPILLYWLAKPCIALFGDMWGPRIPSVLATIALYALIAWFCRRRFSDQIAQLAVLISASSLLIAALGRMMMTDPLLNLSLAAALLTFWESVDGSKRWRWVAGLSVGVGILAKGPVALILFGIVIVWLFARHKELRPTFRGGWLGFWALLAVAVCSWYVPAYLANGQVFVQKFLIEQNIGRFTGGDAAHTLGGLASLGLYVPLLLIGMLPWSFWVPVSLLKRNDRPSAVGSFLASWAVVVFLFFTISGAKLPHYILPVFPPLAILVAARLKSANWLWFGMAWCAALCVGLNVLQSWYYRASGQEEAHRLVRVIQKEIGKGSAAFYQLSRRQSDRGTGTTNLQETSLPSLLLYLNGTSIDTEDFGAILKGSTPVWIFTRKGRIGPEEFAQAQTSGLSLEKLSPAGVEMENFELYWVVTRKATGENVNLPNLK